MTGFYARMVVLRVARELYLLTGAVVLACSGWLDRHPLRRLT